MFAEKGTKIDYKFFFNSIGKPYNPYENSGGIMSSSLLVQKVKPELDDLARKYEYVMNIFESMAGGEMVQFNNSLLLSLKSSMDRDFSLAYFMRENGCFPPGADIKKILEFYFPLKNNCVWYFFKLWLRNFVLIFAAVFPICLRDVHLDI